jgi:LPXTG-motif cell wall-anchored protein
MSKRLARLFVIGLVAAWGLALGGTAFAQDGLGPGWDEDCVEEVMDLPALKTCKDAQGRHILDLPALKLREPAPAKPTPKPAPAPAPRVERRLPKTGLHVEDFAAIGLAALAGGAVLIRRLRLAVA